MFRFLPGVVYRLQGFWIAATRGQVARPSEPCPFRRRRPDDIQLCDQKRFAVQACGPPTADCTGWVYGCTWLRLSGASAASILDEFLLTQDGAGPDATYCIDAGNRGLLNLTRSSCVRIPSVSCGRPPVSIACLVIPSETSRLHSGSAGSDGCLLADLLGHA